MCYTYTNAYNIERGVYVCVCVHCLAMVNKFLVCRPHFKFIPFAVFVCFLFHARTIILLLCRLFSFSFFHSIACLTHHLECRKKYVYILCTCTHYTAWLRAIFGQSESSKNAYTFIETRVSHSIAGNQYSVARIPDREREREKYNKKFAWKNENKGERARRRNNRRWQHQQQQKIRTQKSQLQAELKSRPLNGWTKKWTKKRKTKEWKG